MRLAGSRPTKPMSTATLGKLSPSLVLVPHLCAAAIVRLVPGAVQQKVVPTRRREGKIVAR